MRAARAIFARQALLNIRGPQRARDLFVRRLPRSMPAFVYKLLIFVIFSFVASVSQAQVVGELVSSEQGAQPASRTTIAL